MCLAELSAVHIHGMILNIASPAQLSPKLLPNLAARLDLDSHCLHDDGVSTVSTSALAIYGGPRAVRMPPKDRWCRVPRKGLWSIIRHALSDKNTQAGGGGPVGRFESRFCRMTQTQHGLLMNSGTATLHSAYLACGVAPGDEVIVPAYTFFASAAPILACGAKPVFCEVDPQTLTMDPNDLENRITDKTKAICAVHVWGNPARIDHIQDITQRRGLRLVEDCSHAHGASYQGKPVGSWGDIGCFSLQGSKPVSGGEMGIAVTNDNLLYDRMLALAHFGRIRTGLTTDNFQVGGFSYGLKYRPHLYGVLLANASLDRLDELNQRRRRNYEILTEELRGCQAIGTIEKYDGSVRGGILEFILKYSKEFANNVPLGSFLLALRAEGVPAYRDRYTEQSETGKLLHQTQLFQESDGGGLGGSYSYLQKAEQYERLPVSEDLANSLITLPPFTKVSESAVRKCARAIRKVADGLAQISDLRIGK